MKDVANNINKNTILITGAGKGIGLELVKVFLTNPAFQVIATSRNIDQLQELQNSRLQIIQGDLCSNYDYIIGQILKLNQPINILVNNAALVINKPIALVTNNDLSVLMETNFMAPYKLIRDLLSVFISGTHIVNIGNMSGFQGSEKFNGLSLYSSSKAALASLSECVAVELKEKQIFCNCLALGAVDTDMIKLSIPGLKPTVSASEMANYIYNFSQVGNQYYNGQVLQVLL